MSAIKHRYSRLDHCPAITLIIFGPKKLPEIGGCIRENTFRIQTDNQ
ncbi:MAG TPA: twin-arginine translocase TatA/TatE family subunit [Lentibacillus sp.]|nr:twin-arginine translocase TatA/TatE family subunit [Lentibacillus sp.]HLS07523.1 twin-arginine translocase TatA/TatE family subunit [Lentibacillus sp.]